MRIFTPKTLLAASMGLLFLLTGAGCGDDPGDNTGGGDSGAATTDADTTTGGRTCTPAAPSGEASWQVLDLCRPSGQLLGIWASDRNNAWAVGAKGQVLHFDGCTWSTLDPGTDRDLWWVAGVPGGGMFVVGAEGTLLHWTPESGFEAMDSGTDVTLFGLWGSAQDDIYAVGFVADNSKPGVLLHYDGSAWSPVEGLPATLPETPNFFKVWGTAKDDVWVVGRGDVVLHFDGTSWAHTPTGLGTDWVTVTGTSKDDVVMVGGKSGGTLAQKQGDGFEKADGVEFIQSLQGVCLAADGSGLATGLGATFLKRATSGAWAEYSAAPFDLFNPNSPPVEGCQAFTPDYHACTSDGAGGWFVVGGNFLGGLTEGALLYYGPTLPTAGL